MTPTEAAAIYNTISAANIEAGDRFLNDYRTLIARSAADFDDLLMILLSA